MTYISWKGVKHLGHHCQISHYQIIHLPSLGPIVYRLPPVERRVYPSIRPNLLCSGCYLLCLLKDFSPVFLLHHNFSLYHFHAYTNTLSGFHFIPHPGLQPHMGFAIPPFLSVLPCISFLSSPPKGAGTQILLSQSLPQVL